jgi:hypothetical protein
MVTESSWRDAPGAWFERWTAKPLSLGHVRAVVTAETHLAEMMQLLCGALRDTLTDRTRRYPELRWQDLRSEDVIGAFTIGALVRRHMVTGMPAEIAALPPPTIRWFYWETLILLATVDARQAMTDPLDLAMMAAECDLGLPWLAAEFRRRIKREPVGVRAAVILMNRYLEKDSIEKGMAPGPADDGRLFTHAWEPLTNMAMSHLPTRKSEDRETDREEVAQYVAEVALRRWGSLHPLIALARALNGGMRILSTAAADRVQGDRSKKWAGSRRELKVGFEGSTVAENPSYFLITNDEELRRCYANYLARAKAIQDEAQALIDAFRRGPAQPVLRLDERS